MTEPQTKTCSKCKTEQPITEFSPCTGEHHSPTYRNAWCKACHRKATAERHRRTVAMLAAVYSNRRPSHNARLKMRRARYGWAAG